MRVHWKALGQELYRRGSYRKHVKWIEFKIIWPKRISVLQISYIFTRLAECFYSSGSLKLFFFLTSVGCSFLSFFSCGTADRGFIQRWSVSLSLGQDYTQSNPELRGKTRSILWERSSHHLWACPAHWPLRAPHQINPTWSRSHWYGQWIHTELKQTDSTLQSIWSVWPCDIRLTG